jgi:DNA-binding YbaB/EbfC family protein
MPPARSHRGNPIPSLATRREGSAVPQGGMNPNKMMKQMQKMQEEMAIAQEQLAQERVSASAGGGAVKATVSGGLELLEIEIDPAVVDPEDVEILQDAVVAAVNEAMRQAQQLVQERLGAVAGPLGNLGIPGL